MINVNVKQGKNGRWRWFLRRDGEFKGMGSIQGFHTREAAAKDAQSVLGDSAEIEGEYGPLYAGERDFSD